MSTYMAIKATIERKWYVVDAAGKPLGKTAATAAVLLRGKHKPEYTPHVDTGDNIVVINADKIVVTGGKEEKKKYYRHTMIPGGIYETSYRLMQEKYPGRVLEKAVKGMLPNGPRGYAMIKKLHVYAGAEHPHTAQQPKVLDI